jgi:hypothetical protein
MSGLSYSHYAALRKCGRYYKLRVLDQKPEPGSVAFAFGSALHSGLHTLLKDQDPELATQVFQIYWDTSITGLDFTGERNSADVLRAMGGKFIHNYAKKYASGMQLITGEKRLYGTIPQSLSTSLEGTPDALVGCHGQNVLLDFKSSAYNYPQERTDVSLQMNLYAYLLEENGHTVDALAYNVFNKGTGCIQTPHIVPYDRKKALTMIEEMVSYFLRNKDHHERNPNACIMGKQICPYLKECFPK